MALMRADFSNHRPSPSKNESVSSRRGRAMLVLNNFLRDLNCSDEQ